MPVIGRGHQATAKIRCRSAFAKLPIDGRDGACHEANATDALFFFCSPNGITATSPQAHRCRHSLDIPRHVAHRDPMPAQARRTVAKTAGGPRPPSFD